METTIHYCIILVMFATAGMTAELLRGISENKKRIQRLTKKQPLLLE